MKTADPLLFCPVVLNHRRSPPRPPKYSGLRRPKHPYYPEQCPRSDMTGWEGNREGRHGWGDVSCSALSGSPFFAVLEHASFGRSAFFKKLWYYFYKVRIILCLAEWIIFRLWHKSYKNLPNSFHLWWKMSPGFILVHLFLTRESSDLKSHLPTPHLLAFIFGRPGDKYSLMPAGCLWIQEFQEKLRALC